MAPSFGDCADSMRSQAGLAKRLLRDERFSPLMLGVWSSDFGGSVHLPVVPFFYRAMGASDVDIGRIGFMCTLAQFLFAPVFGWVVDRKSIFFPVLWSKSICGFGCLWMACASDLWMLFAAQAMMGLSGGSVWTMVKAFLSAHSEPSDRALMVSGFDFQNLMIGLLGQACFPPIDWLLRSKGGMEDLFFYRLVIGICVFFCCFGSLVLLQWGAQLRQMSPPTLGGKDHAEEAAMVSCCRPGAAACLSRPKLLFALLAVLVMAQSFSVTVATVLWPLYGQDTYGLGPRFFAVLGIARAVLNTLSIANLPALVAGGGDSRSVLGLHGFLAVAALFFVAPLGMLSHVVSALAFFAAATLVNPALVVLASLAMGRTEQGRSFGVLDAVKAAGAMAGNLLGTMLYAASKGWSTDVEMLGEGRLPFVVVAVLQVFGGIALVAAFSPLNKSLLTAAAFSTDVQQSDHTEEAELCKVIGAPGDVDGDIQG